MANPASILRAAFADPSRPAFVGFLTAGFPSLESTVPALLAMQESGVNVIEVGVPFSDPLADGGQIQIANQKALENGIKVGKVLHMVKEARTKGLTVPVVLMGYWNPIIKYGEERFTDEALAAGVNGFITVDLPIEECAPFVSICDRKGLAFVPLVAPTTPDERLEAIVKVAKGFIYCVSVLGVTGVRTDLPPDLGDFITRLKTKVNAICERDGITPPPPLAVGFGISTREQVKAVGALKADGVVMGSAIIKKIQAEGVDGLETFLTGLLKDIWA
jgi:tryptophan synthase